MFISEDIVGKRFLQMESVVELLKGVEGMNCLDKGNADERISRGVDLELMLFRSFCTKRDCSTGNINIYHYIEESEFSFQMVMLA